jgi:hypothetical protein
MPTPTRSWAIVQAADGPVQVRAVGEELGLQVAVRGKREVSRRPTIFAEVIRGATGTSIPDITRTRRATCTFTTYSTR